MEPYLVTAVLAILTGALTYVLGLLKERSTRLRELQLTLSRAVMETKAYQNRLLIKEGRQPIFKEGGIVSVEYAPDDVPLMQVLKPPFAQAELDWEEEEANKKPMTMAEAMGAFVPPLSEEEKDAMRRQFTSNQ